jgi:hypothetical protein
MANILFATLFILSSLVGFITGSPEPQVPLSQVPSLGAALPSATANFETSLAAPITSSATSMTLSANSVRGGGSLSGYQCFTIDEGSAQAETVCGTISGTSVTSMSRGISQATGTTTVSALQFAHRRGASVKITDYPVIQILKAQANGEDTYNNILKYSTTTPDCASADEICDYGFITGLAFNGAGVIDATAVAKGVVELATQIESASSTSAGSSGNLAIPASSATSTYNSATAPLRIVVTQNSGKIDNYFISTTTLYTYPQATTTVFTANGTWVKPSNVSKVEVEVVGGGAGGGGASATGECAAGGGGAGGYARAIVSVTGNVTVTIGAGGAGDTDGSGTGTNGGNSSFAGATTITANGGTGGSSCGSDNTGTAGGAGGSTTNGDFGVTGGTGGTGHFSGTATVLGGDGGESVFGHGGPGSVDGTSNGGAGVGYGAGGGGASDGAAGTPAGGAGTGGIVVVRWYTI